MKIAIIGAGNIGATLGQKWAQAGFDIIFGVRDPKSPKMLAALNHITLKSIETIANAIDAGEVIVWAVPGEAIEPIVAANTAVFDDQIMIDATNRIGDADMSAKNLLTTHAPKATIFRAFSTLGWENFSEPIIGGTQADLFYCGNEDPAARRRVENLITDIGLRPIYLGGLEQSPVLDGITRLWSVLAYGQKKGRHLAFKLLESSGPIQS